MTSEKTKDMEEWPESHLWRFACALYARPGVKEVCLYLQDTIDADVNLILFCLWRAKTGMPALTPQQITQLETAVASWRTSIIQPLRHVRKMAGNFQDVPGNDIIRNKILQAEIEAEHAEHLLLEHQVLEFPGELAGPVYACARETAYLSLEIYLGQIAPDCPPECHTALNTLLDAAFIS